MIDETVARLIARDVTSEQYAALLEQANKLATEIATQRVLLWTQGWTEEDGLFSADYRVDVANLLRTWAAAAEERDASVALLNKPTVPATGQVTKSTLLTQFAALPCGQRFAIILIFLCVLGALDLPPDVRDHIEYLIGVFSAGLWLASKVTKS
jgi:hypothetical protein